MFKRIIGTLMCAVCLACTLTGCSEEAVDISTAVNTAAGENSQEKEKRSVEDFIKKTSFNGVELPYPLTAGELKKSFELQYDDSFSSNGKRTVWLCIEGAKQAYVTFETDAPFEEIPDDMSANSLYFMGNYYESGKKPSIGDAAFGYSPKKVMRKLGAPDDKLEGNAAFFYYFGDSGQCRLTVIFHEGRMFSFNYTGIDQGGIS